MWGALALQSLGKDQFDQAGNLRSGSNSFQLTIRRPRQRRRFHFGVPTLGEAPASYTLMSPRWGSHRRTLL